MTGTLIATIILSATAGVAAGFWILLLAVSVRQHRWGRSVAHLSLALATGSSTILLVLRSGGGLIIPQAVSTAILALLFLVPAFMAWRDERRAQRLLHHYRVDR